MSAATTMCLLRLLLLPLATSSPSTSGAGRDSQGRGPWGAGWGFAAAGGVPPQPAGMQSYLLNKSVVGYFVANNTGLASAAELAAEVKLGIVGIGWNLNHLATSESGGLEQYEAEQAAALKAARPDVGVMVLRNTEVVSTFWTAFRDAMNDTDIWLQSPPGSGKPINEPWGTDDPASGGVTPKYFLNFSNPKTQTWWLDKYIGPALDQPHVDGVYTDCSCGTARGETVTQAELAGRQKAFDAALALAKSKGKWMSAATGPAVVRAPSVAGDHCADTMKALMKLGADPTKGMQLQGSRPRTAPYSFTKEDVAIFLLTRGPSAQLILPAYDHAMIGREFSVQGVDPNGDPGTPVGPATVRGSVFTRSYSRATVTLDCSTFNATITLT